MPQSGTKWFFLFSPVIYFESTSKDYFPLSAVEQQNINKTGSFSCTWVGGYVGECVCLSICLSLFLTCLCQRSPRLRTLARTSLRCNFLLPTRPHICTCNVSCLTPRSHMARHRYLQVRSEMKE